MATLVSSGCTGRSSDIRLQSGQLNSTLVFENAHPGLGPPPQSQEMVSDHATQISQAKKISKANIRSRCRIEFYVTLRYDKLH